MLFRSEKGYLLLKKKGLLGFILPNKFFNTDYGRALRGFIVDQKALDMILDFGSNQVFENATTYCCLLFLSTIENTNFNYLKVNPRMLNDALNSVNLTISETLLFK